MWFYVKLELSSCRIYYVNLPGSINQELDSINRKSCKLFFLQNFRLSPTRVFTWYNSSLRVSRRASMCTSYAMMALRVTLPVEEEGAKIDGAEEARGVAVSIRCCFNRNWASVHLMVAASIAHVTNKCRDLR